MFSVIIVSSLKIQIFVNKKKTFYKMFEIVGKILIIIVMNIFYPIYFVLLSFYIKNVPS